jgi:hypothetical protein
VKWSSSDSRVNGTPGALYILGLTSDPSEGSETFSTLANNLGERRLDWRGGARTRLSLGFGASVQTSGEIGSEQGRRQEVDTRRDNLRFPVLEVEYGRVANLIGLGKILQTPRLRTSFDTNRSVDYLGGERTSVATGSQWRPLMEISGELKNGARTEFKVERRNTVRELFQLGYSKATTQNTDVNFSLNRQYSQGQKVSFLGKETTVKSSINLGASAAYSVEEGKTVGADGRDRFPVKNSRLSVNTNGSYGFSNNVNGSAQLGFLQTKDQRNIIRRSLRVELSARFTF